MTKIRMNFQVDSRKFLISHGKHRTWNYNYQSIKCREHRHIWRNNSIMFSNFFFSYSIRRKCSHRRLSFFEMTPHITKYIISYVYAIHFHSYIRRVQRTYKETHRDVCPLNVLEKPIPKNVPLNTHSRFIDIHHPFTSNIIRHDLRRVL